eukprot:TRINITY_DN11267_c0_g1_i1.p1 TRINITY_DN11267_c0_g1~~TRINITY_DN11267_c0_g1_i1.p1  ORF type:complete len:514 (+),score=94.39 TRINITY_DN11267_c0_g1_i1:42-1544(+)
MSTWSCLACTYINPISNRACEICLSPKPKSSNTSKQSEDDWYDGSSDDEFAGLEFGDTAQSIEDEIFMCISIGDIDGIKTLIQVREGMRLDAEADTDIQVDENGEPIPKKVWFPFHEIKTGFSGNMTPLMFAVTCEQIEVINYLIKDCGVLYKTKNFFDSLDLYPDLKNEIFPAKGDCTICGDENITLHYLSKCFDTFCVPCLDQWISARVKDQSHMIVCPDRNCSKQMEYNEILSLLSDENKKVLFERKTLEMFLLQSNDFKWCPKCENGGFQTDEGCGTCTECDFSWCFSCNRENHIGFSCDEYTTLHGHLDDEFYLNWWWKKKNSKICPKCRCSIEKSGGCSHMTCQQCSYDFCWLCGRKYKSGNYVYTESCNCADNLPEEDEYFHLISELWHDDVVSVELKLTLDAVHHGDNATICLFGGHPLLGEWAPAKGQLMFSEDQVNWRLLINLPVGEDIEYKLAVVDRETRNVLEEEAVVERVPINVQEPEVMNLEFFLS